MFCPSLRQHNTTGGKGVGSRARPSPFAFTAPQRRRLDQTPKRNTRRSFVKELETMPTFTQSDDGTSAVRLHYLSLWHWKKPTKRRQAKLGEWSLLAEVSTGVATVVCWFWRWLSSCGGRFVFKLKVNGMTQRTLWLFPLLLLIGTDPSVDTSWRRIEVVKGTIKPQQKHLFLQISNQRLDKLNLDCRCTIIPKCNETEITKNKHNRFVFPECHTEAAQCSSGWETFLRVCRPLSSPRCKRVQNSKFTLRGVKVWTWAHEPL